MRQLRLEVASSAGTLVSDEVARQRVAPVLPAEPPLSPAFAGTLLLLVDLLICLAVPRLTAGAPLPARAADLVLFAGALCLALTAASGGYAAAHLFRPRRQVAATLTGAAGALAGVAAAAALLNRQGAVDPAWGLLASFGSAAMLAAWRLLFGIAVTHDPRRRLAPRAAIVGAGPDDIHIVDALKRSRALRLIGTIDAGDHPTHGCGVPGLPHLGAPGHLLHLVARGEVEDVIVALPFSAGAQVQRLLDSLADYPVAVHLVAAPVGLAATGAPHFLPLAKRPIADWASLLKRLEDIVLAALLLALAALPMALLAALVRLDSAGPVLFRQQRAGYGMRPFVMLKFRTMHHHPSAALRQAVPGDPRITRLGAWLRRTSLDELPQLINVLRGEMSLVGPRPHAPGTTAGGRPFEVVAAHYVARHRVKPGLTGLAQVRGQRGPTETEDKLRARVQSDLEYIENWSLWLDALIVIRTAASVLRMKNAC